MSKIIFKYDILVPPNNPDAFAMALMQVLSDDKPMNTLLEFSLKRAQDFELQKSLKKWEHVILSF